MADLLRKHLLQLARAGTARLPRRERAMYLARAESEIDSFARAGWLPATLEAAETVSRLVCEGVPLVAAHRSNEPVLFFLLGLTSTDPIGEDLSDPFLAGQRGADPGWLWFGPVERPPYVAAHAQLALLAQRAGVSTMALQWHSKSTGEIRRLRSAIRCSDARLPAHGPDSWQDLVIQHGCATPRACRIGMYQAVLNGQSAEDSATCEHFGRTGGIPVFEDDVVRYLRSRLGGLRADPTQVYAARSAARRGDLVTLRATLETETDSQLGRLATYGPSVMPRSAAVGEARLELCAASNMWAGCKGSSTQGTPLS